MSRGDKEAIVFSVVMFAAIAIGTGIVAYKEHVRNSSCAELGGIVVNLKCGKFEAIEGWEP